MSRSSQVLVVGAGPTGLTAAVELLRRGVDTRIVDNADRHDPHSRAIVLWPRALDVFARISAEEAVRAAAIPIVAANYFSAGRRVARIAFRKMPGSRWDTPLSLPQNETERILRDALAAAGGTVEYGHRLTSVRLEGDGAVAAFGGGSAERDCSWLVGADGSRSAVRKSLRIGFEGSQYEQEFVLLDGRWDTPLHHLESYYFMDPTGVLVVVGLPGGLCRVFASLPPQHPTPAPGDALEEVVTDLAARRCPFPLRLMESAGGGAFTIQRRIADRFRVGRVLLAGDAAHVHSPAGGQGLNTSIQDAHEAAWRLAGVLSGQLPQGRLDEWERERQHVARAVVSDTDRQTRMWLSRGWRARGRDAALQIAERTGLLDRTAPQRLAQLRLNYPTPGIYPRRQGRLAPGRRVPDLALPSGALLHDLLRTGRHLLLIFAADTSAAAGYDAGWEARHDATVVRMDREVAQSLGVRGQHAVLVRPDGVVALAGSPADPALRSRLEDALPPLPVVEAIG